MTADTFGWDTVYAIKYTDVNTSILNAWQALPINQTSGPASISGDFSPWQVTLGGSGHLVRMVTPVPALLYNGTTTYNATATIEVQLEFIPQPLTGLRGTRAARGTSGGQWHDLRLMAGPDAVSILEVAYAGATPNSLDQAVIKDLFRQWFNTAANLQDFNLVFASVNLNAKADVDAFQWLQATEVAYAVAEETALPDGVFAVLCMTEGRPAAGLAHQVSAYAIPTGARSAFLISPERYLRKLLMPGIGLMFTAPANPGTKAWPDDYFRLEDDGVTIMNTEPLTIAQLQIDENNTREATIGARQFAVRLAGSTLTVDFTNLQHDYTAGLLQWLKVDHTIHSTATASLRDGQKFALDPGAGTHTIVVTKSAAADWVQIGLDVATLFLLTTGVVRAGFLTARAGQAAEAGNQLSQGTELIPVAKMPDTVANDVAEAGATGCLGSIRGGLVSGKTFLSAVWQSYRASWFAVIGTATGFAAGVEEVLTKIAGATSQNDLPDFNVFAAGVMSPVQWPNTESDFNVTAVAFNDSFQVSGDPGFAD